MGCYTSLLLFDHFTSRRSWLCPGWDGGDFTFESCCGELRPEAWDWRVVDGRDWDWKCMAFGNGRSCFPAGDVWFFLKRTPFSYKLSNVYQVFLVVWQDAIFTSKDWTSFAEANAGDVYTGITSTEWRLSSNLIFLHPDWVIPLASVLRNVVPVSSRQLRSSILTWSPWTTTVPGFQYGLLISSDPAQNSIPFPYQDRTKPLIAAPSWHTSALAWWGPSAPCWLVMVTIFWVPPSDFVG